MTTPLQTIKDGEREFEDKFLASCVGQDDNGELYDLFAGTKTVGDMKRFIKTQTLALLQAQRAELEGRKFDFDNSKDDDICKQSYYSYNQAIQDQIDSLDALIKELTT